MDAEHNPYEQHPPEPIVWMTQEDAEEPRRRKLLRRLRILLLTGGLAFALTTWMLVRVENPAVLFGLGPGPSSVARAHLDALNRGALREAYELFSAQYREKVTFQMYHRLYITYRDVLSSESVGLEARESGNELAIVDTHLVAQNGERYLARFTMVRVDGRWWIDDLRWSLDADETDLIQT